MFCQKCGKEISDQARFCNHCGTPVNDVRPQTAPAVQPKPAKKKSKASKFLLFILAVIILFGGYFFLTEYVIYAPDEPASIYTGEQALVDAMMSSYCNKGALYQDGYLTYSLAKVHLPGYTLDSGEGDEADWLISPDGNSAFSVDRVMDAGTSYKESDAEGILESIGKGDGTQLMMMNSSADANPYTDISMVDFRKYEICGHPVIRYIVKYTYNDVEQYSGELILFEGETANFYTVRLLMDSRAEIGHGEIDRVFDSLQFSPEFALGSEYPQTGVNKITVK